MGQQLPALYCWTGKLHEIERVSPQAQESGRQAVFIADCSTGSWPELGDSLAISPVQPPSTQINVRLFAANVRIGKGHQPITGIVTLYLALGLGSLKLTDDLEQISPVIL